MKANKNFFRMPRLTAIVAASVAVVYLGGCTYAETRQMQKDIGHDAATAIDTSQPSHPIVQVHEGSLLMGEQIAATKAPPEVYSRYVDFNSGSSSPSLNDVVSYLTDIAHIPAVIDSSAMGSSAAAAPAAGGVGVNITARPAARVDLPSGLATALSGNTFDGAVGFGLGPLKYRGPVSGLLEVVDARFGVWSHFKDGRVSFFRTETRSFSIASLPDQSQMCGTISTASGGGGGGTCGGGGSSSNNTSNNIDNGSQSMSLQLKIDPWATLKETAASVAGPGATVTVDSNLGMLTVSGSPPQCDRVEDFVHNLDATLNKQVAIDVHVYEVRENAEDNYGINAALSYASKTYGATSTSVSAPTVTSSSTPLTLGASILSGPFSGSKIAIQALSTLGNVSEVVSRSGVTQNGKLLALQSAQSEGYVSSVSTTSTAQVGSTNSVQTSTLVPGFTSSFVPKVVDGKILLTFDMTLSDLLSLSTFSSGSGTTATSVQLPTMQLARFEQSISLRPGETLVLTGMRQQTANSTANGVGSPYNPLLGGGIDGTKNQTLLAVVITARLL